MAPYTTPTWAIPQQRSVDQRPRRVLHVSQPTAFGVDEVITQFVRHQRAAGLTVGVASPNKDTLPGHVHEAGADHIVWQAGREPNAAVLRETASLRRIVQQYRPDVVHLHSSKAGLAGRLALRGSLPTIFSPHGWSFLHVGGAVNRATVAWERHAGARWTDAVLCCSIDEQTTGAEIGIRANYEVVQNSAHIEHPGLTREQARELLGLPLDKPIAICFGRYAHQKGQDVLLEAWPAIKGAVPDAVLGVIGSGPLEDELRAQASPEVIMQPSGDRARAAAWMLSADVLVFPSRWEGYSLTVLEALELGRPVVVTDCQGMSEAMEGGAGRMVPVEDTQALARAVVHYLADRAMAHADGELAQRRYEEVHVPARQAKLDRYAGIVERLSAARR